MTTLQRGICLGCVLVAVAAAITTGLLVTPSETGADAREPEAQAIPASDTQTQTQAQAQKPTPAPEPQAASPTQTQSQAQAQNPTPTPAAAGPGMPPVRVEPQTFDFGLSNPNDLVWTQFKVINPSSQTLYIKEVKPACKCTVPTLDSKVLPPGGQITIDASVDLRGTVGDVKKNFHVFFEGYPKPIECVIKGVLSYPVQVTPARPSVAVFPRDRTGQLYLRSLEDRPFRVCAVNGREPDVLFKNSPGEEATEWRVQYTLDAAGTEDLPYMLLVETTHPGARMLDLKLTGQPVSGRELEFIKQWKDIFVNRNNVNLGVIPKGGTSDFETSVMRPDHGEPCIISFDREGTSARTDDLAAEIVNIAPVDGRPKEEMYTIRVTNLSDENELVQMPLYFHSKEHTARLWIGARLLPSPADDQCATE